MTGVQTCALPILDKPPQNGGEAVHRVHRPAGAGGERGHGVIGAVDVGAAVDQIEYGHDAVADEISE